MERGTCCCAELARDTFTPTPGRVPHRHRRPEGAEQEGTLQHLRQFPQSRTRARGVPKVRWHGTPATTWQQKWRDSADSDPAAPSLFISLLHASPPPTYSLIQIPTHHFRQTLCLLGPGEGGKACPLFLSLSSYHPQTSKETPSPSSMRVAYCLLPTAYCLDTPAYCLTTLAFRLFAIAYCPLPTAR